MSLNKYLDTGNGLSLSDIFNNIDFTIKLDGYEYTAVIDRNYTLSSDVQSEKSEKGLEYCDHAYIAPTSISYKIIVSKLDLTEFNKLIHLYSEKIVTNLMCSICNLSSCIISDLSVDDSYADIITINITIDEIKFGTVTTILPSDSRFQLLSETLLGSNSVDLAITTDDVTSNETANSENYYEYLDIESTKYVGISSGGFPFQGSGYTVAVNNGNFGYLSYLKNELETKKTLESSSLVSTASHVDNITDLYFSV